MLRVNSEFLHYFRAGRAQAETVQADHFPVEANVLIPNFGDAGFDGEAHRPGLEAISPIG